MRWFWQQFCAGVIGAMSDKINEPFAVWPCPPLPEPTRWAERMLRLPLDEEEDTHDALPKLRL